MINVDLIRTNLLNICVYTGIVLLISLILLLISESSRDALVRLFYDRKGYFIYSKNFLRNKYVTDVSLNIRQGSWHKYIVSLKNIVRLYDIVSEYDRKNHKELHKEIYKRCEKFVNEKQECNDNKMHANKLLLVIMEVIGFCNYIYFQETDLYSYNNIGNNVQSLVEAVILDVYGETNADNVLVNSEFYEYKEMVSKLKHK